MTIGGIKKLFLRKILIIRIGFGLVFPNFCIFFEEFRFLLLSNHTSDVWTFLDRKKSQRFDGFLKNVKLFVLKW